MKKYLIAISILTSFLSCEKQFINKDLNTSDKKENFEYLWNEIDKKYSFFDLKNVNWDSVKLQYSAQITNNMSNEAFFTLMGNMLNELKDDHTNLVSPFNQSIYNIPAKYPSQIYEPLIDRLFPNLTYTGMFRHTIIDSVKIGYIRFPQFSNVTEENYDYVLNNYRNTKGLIFDIRGNSGGVGKIVNILLSRLTNTTKLVGYEQMRNGPNHEDFSTPAEVIIEPKGTYYNKPIIVLTDRGCYSSSTYFALSSKSFENITLIGDTTGGGAGMPNGGELPNGWTYRCSITRLLDKDKRNYAEQGVPPDILVSFNWQNLNRDEVIDKAIERLR